MKPKDALGELVKELHKLLNMPHRNPSHRELRLVASQIDNALEGKVVVDRGELQMFVSAFSELIQFFPEETGRMVIMLSKREFVNKYLPKENKREPTNE